MFSNLFPRLSARLILVAALTLGLTLLSYAAVEADMLTQAPGGANAAGLSYSNSLDTGTQPFGGSVLLLYPELFKNKTCPNLKIAANPPAAAVVYGEDAVFTASASDPAAAVQWQVFSGAAWQDIDGAQAAALTVIRPMVSQEGQQYRAVFTSSCSPETASTLPASLMVYPRPITVTADPQTKVYKEMDPALTYQITEGSLEAGDSLGGSLTRDKGEDLGSYPIGQGSLTASANYALTFVSSDLTIVPRPLTVIADTVSKVYGDKDPYLSYRITSGSLINGDTLRGFLSRAPGENVGVYAVQQGTLSASENYALTFSGSTLTIDPRPVTVGANAYRKTYGDPDPEITYTLITGSLVNGDTFSGSLARAGGESVGSYPVYQGTLTLNSNYTMYFVGTSLTIEPRPLTVSASAQTKPYGDPDPPLNYSAAGALVPGDSFTGALSREAGEQVGVYNIQLGSLSAGPNYDLRFEGASFSISPRMVAAFFTAADKVYDNTLTASISGRSLLGVIEGDHVSLAGGSAEFTDPQIGQSKSVIGNGFFLTGADAGNYRLSSTTLSAAARVTYASTGIICHGAPGRRILPPINFDGTSLFTKGSIIPVRFRVCGADGISIGDPGVVADIRLVQISSGTAFGNAVTAAKESAPDTAFRWDSAEQQWIFNLSTRYLNPNYTYHYQIVLNDGSEIGFALGVK